jgi:hypothetical protein
MPVYFLLSALDLNTPRYRSGFRVSSNWFPSHGVHEPMSAAIREFNKFIGLFDIILTHNQFMNYLKLTL